MHLFGLDLEAPLQRTNIKVASLGSVVVTSGSGYFAKLVMCEAPFDRKFDVVLLRTCLFVIKRQEAGGAYAIALAWVKKRKQYCNP